MSNKKLFIICLITAFLVAGFVTSASAYTLLLQATKNGTEPKTAFSVGEDLYLNIVVDDAADIAGCAFTLNYPATVLTPPTTDENGVSSGITSIFPFTYNDSTTTHETHRGNSSTAGKIYLAGAAIDTLDGGALYDNAADHTLFTIHFTVKSDAPLGAFDLSLTQTVLDNVDAGYVAPNNTVPVLVGAVDNTDAAWGGEDLSDDFPVLLGNATYPFTTVMNSDCSIIEYSISGTISYSGHQTGTLSVAAFASSDTNLETPIGAQTYDWIEGTTSKSFTVSVLNGSYTLGASIDSAGGTADTRDAWEAQGTYTTPIDIDGAGTSGKDFTLSDPDLNEDGIADWWKLSYDTGAGEDIGAAGNDYDQDGYSNLVEYQNGTDPTVQDAAGGTGYNSATDNRYIEMEGLRTHSGYYTSNEPFEVTLQIEYSGELTALGVQEIIPDGWSYVSVGGDDAPTVPPAPGATDTLDFAWITAPASPVAFTYTVQVPEGESGEKPFTGEILYRRHAGEITETISATTAQKKTFHDADYNPADWSINLSELLRIIQIYNVGSFHCDAEGEDGYGLGSGDQSGTPHDLDYNPQDWSFGLSELLRMIQIYNVGAYHVDPEGEDGYGLGSGE